jgi:hypothetical protein
MASESLEELSGEGDIFEVPGFSVMRQLIASVANRIKNANLTQRAGVPRRFTGKRQELVVFAIC